MTNSDDGKEAHSYFQSLGVKHLLYVGAASNMCILQRSDATLAMSRWGYDVAVMLGLGRVVALHHRSSASHHTSRYIIVAKRFGASVSETAMRRNPRWCATRLTRCTARTTRRTWTTRARTRCRCFSHGRPSHSGTA